MKKKKQGWEESKKSCCCLGRLMHVPAVDLPMVSAKTYTALRKSYHCTHAVLISEHAFLSSPPRGWQHAPKGFLLVDIDYR